MAPLLALVFYAVIFLAALKFAWPWIWPAIEFCLMLLGAFFAFIVQSWDFISAGVALMVGISILLHAYRKRTQLGSIISEYFRQAIHAGPVILDNIVTPLRWTPKGLIAAGIWMSLVGSIPIMLSAAYLSGGNTALIQLSMAVLLCFSGALVCVGSIIPLYLWIRSPSKSLLGWQCLVFICACFGFMLGYPWGALRPEAHGLESLLITTLLLSSPILLLVACILGCLRALSKSKAA